MIDSWFHKDWSRGIYWSRGRDDIMTYDKCQTKDDIVSVCQKHYCLSVQCPVVKGVRSFARLNGHTMAHYYGRCSINLLSRPRRKFYKTE